VPLSAGRVRASPHGRAAVWEGKRVGPAAGGHMPVYNLHGNPLVFPWLEGVRSNTAHCLEDSLVHDSPEGALQLLPGVRPAGEKGLANEEGPTIVVLVQEPRRHLFT